MVWSQPGLGDQARIHQSVAYPLFFRDVCVCLVPCPSPIVVPMAVAMHAEQGPRVTRFECVDRLDWKRRRRHHCVRGHFIMAPLGLASGQRGGRLRWWLKGRTFLLGRFD